MTILQPNSNINNTAGMGAGQPGAAPVGSTMQGNPQASQIQPSGVQPPNAQNIRDGVAADNTKTCVQQIAQGQIPLNIQPGNIGSGGAASNIDGTRSLLAMLSTGQVVLGASNYGQGNVLPVGAGIPAVGNSVASPLASGINSISGSVAAGTVAYNGN